MPLKLFCSKISLVALAVCAQALLCWNMFWCRAICCTIWGWRTWFIYRAAVTLLRLPGPIFWRKKKTTGQVKIFKSINQYHPIIWFLALPKSLLLQHNRHDTVFLACAILSFYYQWSKWNNGFRQRRRYSLQSVLMTPIPSICCPL